MFNGNKANYRLFYEFNSNSIFPQLNPVEIGVTAHFFNVVNIKD